MNGQKLETSVGDAVLEVEIVEGNIFIVSPAGIKAKVVEADIKACRAVIHFVDMILEP